MDVSLQLHEIGHSARGVCHGFQPLCDKLLQHFNMDKPHLYSSVKAEMAKLANKHGVYYQTWAIGVSGAHPGSKVHLVT